MKPIILEGSWVISAPLPRLYKIITDFENAPKYFPLVAQSLKIIKKQSNHLTIEAVSKTFGIPFKVMMQTELLPNQGFRSINTSTMAVENESFLMEEISTGTRINYRNKVQIKNNFLQIIARIFINKSALLFWKFAYIDRLQKLATST